MTALRYIEAKCKLRDLKVQMNVFVCLFVCLVECFVVFMVVGGPNHACCSQNAICKYAHKRTDQDCCE